MLEHDVWATPPGNDEPVYFASFDLEKWQLAQKLAGLLIDKGYTDVEVILDTGDVYEYPEKTSQEES